MADNSPRTQRVKKKRKRIDSDKDEIKVKSSKRLAMEPESEANVKDTTEKELFKNAEAFEESDSSDEETCGMKRPNLLEQLKTILDTYPDDAQIIKELIQNAEDADANEIKLLHDKRVIQPDGEYGKYLKAPALCVYNDAKFSDEDWDGIISIYNSIKKNNKLKVGRFGLGFKSVFHMTDHPVIISGDRMLVIDPVKSIVSEKDVCITQRLKRLKKPKYKKSLSIILDTFGFHQHVLDTGQYNGTLFWFPLRSETSKLSDNIYTEKKITDLFVTFEEEATLVLIFLKSLTQVKVFQRTERLNNEELYAVTMSGEIKDMKDRERFKQEVQQLNGELPAESLWCTFETKITSISGGQAVERNWVIVNYIQGTNESQEPLKTLAMDSDLSYSPFVGVAYPVNYPAHTEAGHVFCFLPLPIEQKSLTGLPVHVNGFFALEQNRRHVKWASKEQANVIANRDKNVTWNELLIKEVLPRAYERLVLHLKHTCENKKTDVLRVYRSIPVPSAIDDKWEGILDKLLTSLLRQEIFFTESKGGRWINQSDAIFPIFNPANNVQNMEDVITKIILQAGKNFAAIPNSLIEILKEQRYNNITPTEITPTYVRDVLRTCSDYTSYTREEKLSLLRFVGADGTDNTLADLDGLELIPLHDGSFGRFHGKGENVFLCDQGEADLFLGLGHKLVSTIQMPDEVVTIFRQIAESGIYQISPMTSDKFSTLYSDTITTNCRESDRRNVFVPLCKDLNLAWLGQIWAYIEHKFLSENDLESLEHLPLIAEKILKSENIRELYPLKGFYISCHCDGMTSLPEDLLSVLPFLFITILKSLPDFMKRVLGKFIKFPNCENLVQLLSDVLKQVDVKQVIQSFNVKCQPKGREAFVDFICSHVTDGTSSDVRLLLRNLQIFHLSSNVVSFSNTSTKYVTLEENNRIKPKTKIPVPYPYPLIEPKNEDVEKLALKLGAHTLDIRTLVKDILQEMQEITRKNAYNEENKQRFMEYYLENIAFYDQHANELASGVSFIPSSSSSKFFCAKDLFDPSDDELQILFYGETNKFPTSFQTGDMLNALVKIGLKKREDLTMKDLINTALILDAELIGSLDRESKIYKKAEKLKQFLVKCSEKPNEKIKPHELLDLRWVPVMKRPNNYPKFLPWYGDENNIILSKPKDVVASEFCSLSGSVLPIVRLKQKCNAFKVFDWNVAPAVEIVSKQLECIGNCFQPQFKPKISPLISDIYNYLSKVTCNLEILESRRCIMCEDGFNYPSDVYIKHDKDHETLNLTPYISKLPNEFADLSDFFLKVGCKEKLDFKIAIGVLKKIQKKHLTSKSRKDDRSDMNLVIQILFYIDSLDLQQEELEEVLLPVFDKEEHVVLKYPSECTYTDGDTDWLFNVADEEVLDEEVYYVHKDIVSLASRFGVPSFTNRFLTDVDSDEMVIEWGQSEPLTTRLKNLLDGYSDGFAIPKEIIQNADDAGASKIAFLYDERENNDARTRLIDVEMGECQGPALWAYNDAQFQESDFENIIKLGGRTKESNKSTIGKFGLGFCSVYNITDVPSFYSGNSMVIFDPHGQYLGKAIKNKNNPGIRIKLNQRILQNLQNQFKPFNGIFGCDLSEFRGPLNEFQGTLFRLPLRTKKQAYLSDIKDLHYSRQEMAELLDILMKSAGDLLLFTQNLQTIEIYHLNSEAAGPGESRLLFSAQRGNRKTEPSCLHGRNILQHCAISKCEHLSILNEFDIHLNVFDDVQRLCKSKPLSYSTRWLVAWASLNGPSMCKKSGLSVGAAAVPIVEDKGNIYPLELSQLNFGFYRSSHLFCFLPLPVELPLLVHLNGYFAVDNDRKGLAVTSSDDKNSTDVIWNNSLFSGAVCNSFLKLLSVFANNNYHHDKKYHYSSLWPKLFSNNKLLERFFLSFYTKIVSEDHALFCQDGRWFTFDKCAFLDPCFKGDIKKIAFRCLLKFYNNAQVAVADIEEDVIECFTAAGHLDIIQQQTVEIENFYATFFFPNLFSEYWQSKKGKKNRDTLTMFAIKSEK